MESVCPQGLALLANAKLDRHIGKKYNEGMSGAINFKQLNIRPAAKIRLARDGQVFWGPGTVTLLQHIERVGSVRKASESMQISYSKCWKMLAHSESALGAKLGARQKGGIGGGDAYLTPAGKAFLDEYLAFEESCQQAIARIFEQYYPEEEKSSR
mgnify:FL=1